MAQARLCDSSWWMCSSWRWRSRCVVPLQVRMRSSKGLVRASEGFGRADEGSLDPVDENTRLLKALAKDIAELKTGLATKTDLDALKTDFKTEDVSGEIISIKRSIWDLHSEFGRSIERQIRETVGQLFGVRFAEPYLAKSLFDLVNLLPHYVVDEAIPGHKDHHLCDSNFTRKIAEGLVKDEVPKQVLLSLLNSAGASGILEDSPEDLVKDLVAPGSGSVWNALLHKIRSNTAKTEEEEVDESPGLLLMLKLLKEYFSIGCNGKAQTEKLMSCNSPGLHCLIFKACKDTPMFLKMKKIPIYFELEFDCKGTIEFYKNELALIQVAEIKKMISYRKAVGQLAVRAYVLREVLTSCRSFNKIVLIGRMIVPQHFVKESKVDDQQQEQAKDYDMSLYLHVV